MLRHLACAGCGAPVPLGPEPVAQCRHCGHATELPREHVELFAQAARGEAQLEQADRLWRTLPRTMPLVLPKLFAPLTCALVLGLTVTWAAVGRSMLGGPGFSFVVLVLLPAFVAVQLGLELLAYWSPYARLVVDMSALRDPGYPELLLCRYCGAALEVLRDRVVARCAYCRVDNLTEKPRKAAFDRARALDAHGKTQLDDAIASLRMLRMQRAIVRWVGAGTMTALWLVLAFALHGR